MKVMQLLNRRGFNVVIITKRSLFSEQFLGISAFKRKRNKMIATDYSDKFFENLRNVYADPDKRILTHQIKESCYLARSAEDANIIGKALEKYIQGMSGTIVFQNFSSGPEIMRMYHCLNLPVEATSLIKNPITSCFFNDIKSYCMVQDLLYNNGLYDKVCELFRIVQDKELHGRKYPFLNYILYQAACYQLKTWNSFNEAMQMFQEFIKFYKKPVWPIIMYTLILALENGKPELVLQYPLGKDNISNNIKLAALIKIGDITSALKYFNNLTNKSAILQSVVSELCNNVQKLNGKDLSSEKRGILNENVDIHSFKNQTFDELAANTIQSIQSLKFNIN